MFKLPSVALIGRRGSGKSTIAAILETEHGYVRHSWAEPIRRIATWAYGTIAKDGAYRVRRDGEIVVVSGTEIMQRLGTEAMRDRLDEDFWIKVGLRQLAPKRRFVNEDTRFPNEAAALRRIGACLVYVSVPEALRRDRLIARDGHALGDEHASEHSLTYRDADLVIENSDDPDEVVADLVDWLRGWGGQERHHDEEGVGAA